MKTKYKPTIGDKYGLWTVISDAIYTNGRSAAWLVQCECGRTVRRLAEALVNGKTKACKSCCRTTKYKNTFSVSYFNRIKRRAERIGVDIDIDPDYLYDLYIKQDKKCALSGVDIEFSNSWKTKGGQSASLDRIDSTKGYIKSNVQWVHKDINFMKHKFSQDRFIDLCTKVASKCG